MVVPVAEWVVTGPLGARLRLIVAVSVAAPMSSHRIGRNHLEGIANLAGPSSQPELNCNGLEKFDKLLWKGAREIVRLA